MDFRKDNKKKSEKSLWDQAGRKPAFDKDYKDPADEPSEPIEEEMERPKRFKLIKGLMDKGLGSVFKKKQ